MAATRQINFNGGEISSSLYSRVDLTRYQTALRTCRNMITLQQGGVSNRPGTRYLGDARTSTGNCRLLPFIVSEETAYVLEMTSNAFRFIKRDATTGVVGIILDASPAWANSTAYAAGQQVRNDSTPVKIYQCTTGGTSAASPAVGPTGTGTAIADGTCVWRWVQNVAATTYKVVWHPYSSSILRDVNFVQSADVLTMAQEDFPPQELRRYGDADWRLSTWAIVRSIAQPTWSYGGPQGFEDATHPSKLWYYVATSQRFDPPEESLPSGATQVDAPIYLDRTCLAAYYLYNLVPPYIDQINIYRGLSYTGPFGFVGSVKVLPGGSAWPFIDDVSIPSYIDCPPSDRNPFSGAGNYPRCVAYHEQRLVFAGSVNNPQTIWLSRSGNFKNFDYSEPSQDDDSITMTIASNKVDAIRGLFSARTLLVLTVGAEYVVSGADGPLTPSSLDAKAQSYRGAAKLRPLAIGNVVFYLQGKGNRIRELIYDFQQDIYGGADLCILSDHLFRNKTLVDWTYAGVPFSVVWVTRSDGILLGMTYLREHDVVGWHRHDTQTLDSQGAATASRFESVCSIPEGSEDALYCSVIRTLRRVEDGYGAEVRTIERFASRVFENPADGYFVDCGLTHDGWNLTADYVEFSGYSKGDTVTVTSGGSIFGSVVAGEGLFVRDSAYQVYRSQVIEKISATQLSVRLLDDIPTDLQVRLTSWAIAHRVYSGVGHLANQTIAICADGQAHPSRVVPDTGQITLDYPAATVHVGCPYTSEIVTLGLSLDQVDVRNRQKLIVEVGIELEATTGVWIGEDGGELIQAKQRESEPWGSPVEPLTDGIMVQITSTWNQGARVKVQQPDPLPITILGLHPEVEIGG